jgi:hypothetical protein
LQNGERQNGQQRRNNRELRERGSDIVLHPSCPDPPAPVRSW